MKPESAAFGLTSGMAPTNRLRSALKIEAWNALRKLGVEPRVLADRIGEEIRLVSDDPGITITEAKAYLGLALEGAVTRKWETVDAVLAGWRRHIGSSTVYLATVASVRLQQGALGVAEDLCQEALESEPEHVLAQQVLNQVRARTSGK